MLREVRRRLVGSIGAFAIGTVGLLLYLGFLAARFAWYTNLAVVLAVLVSVPAAVVILWIHWGISLGVRLGDAGNLA